MTTSLDDEVTEWGSVGAYVTSQVLYNPKYLDHPDHEKLGTFAHEFTHAATATMTSGWTPQWLVEGIAEYVGRTVDVADDAYVARQVHRIGVPAALPKADGFLGSDEEFLAWLACRVIAERYGPAKLLALYKGVYSLDPERAFRQTLGLSIGEFTQQWRAYPMTL